METLDKEMIHALGGMAHDFIPQLRKTRKFKPEMRIAASFWNIPLNMFRPWLAAGKQNHRKQSRGSLGSGATGFGNGCNIRDTCRLWALPA